MAQDDFLSHIKSMWTKLFAKPDINVTSVTGAAMPIFDTPITSDDAGLQKILQQKMPIILYLYNQADANLDAMLNTVAKEYSGKLLVVRLNASQNPQFQARYKNLTLPAVFALKNGGLQSQSVSAKPADVKANADYVLGLGPKPVSAPSANSAAKAPSKPMPVNDSTFKRDVLESDLPVLVDFWAPWCGPCRTIGPILEKLATKYAGQVKIVKLNVDDNRRTSDQFQTKSIPTLLMFKNGKMVKRLVGAHPQPTIEQMIQTAIKG